MARKRVNPFAVAVRNRSNMSRSAVPWSKAMQAEKEAAIYMTTSKAERALAERYAEALRALGHGDKVPALPALPNYAQLGEK